MTWSLRPGKLYSQAHIFHSHNQLFPWLLACNTKWTIYTDQQNTQPNLSIHVMRPFYCYRTALLPPNHKTTYNQKNTQMMGNFNLPRESIYRRSTIPTISMFWWPYYTDLNHHAISKVFYSLFLPKLVFQKTDTTNSPLLQPNYLSKQSILQPPPQTIQNHTIPFPKVPHIQDKNQTDMKPQKSCITTTRKPKISITQKIASKTWT
jgi:hypothetical protein